MRRPWIVGAVIAFGFLDGSGRSSERPTEGLKEERMTIEYASALDEAAVVFSAESEVGLEQVEIRGPNGATVLDVRAGNGGELGLSGFVVEKGEPSAASIFARYPEGIYRLRARTVDGDVVVGSTRFSHRLLAEPVVVYPFAGALDVPTSNLAVNWVHNAAAARYHVTLEQGETDLMSVELGYGTDTFRVPDGLLQSGKRYCIEIAAVAPNGNSTNVKVPFSTR